MENDDNDLKDHSLPLLIKQSTDDRDDNAKPNLFDGSAKATLESLKGKLIHRDTELDVHAPNDEDYLMSDATSELTSQTYERQTVSGEDVMPYTNLSSSSGPCSSRLPSIREMDTIGHYHVIVECLSPEVDNEVLAMAFSAFGTMSDARVMCDNNSGKSHGYGFLAFADKTDAEQAIATMNGKRLCSWKIRVNWANQNTRPIPCPTTASFVTSSSASTSSSFEYSRLPHFSFPWFVEPRNSRLSIDGGFLEGVGAPDYRPDSATSGRTDSLEGFPGTVLSDPEDSTLFPDTLPYRKTVGSAATRKFSGKRRKNPTGFSCLQRDQSFTTKTNFSSKLSSADAVTHELNNIIQTI